MKVSIHKGSRLQRLRKYFKAQGYSVKLVRCHNRRTNAKNERKVVFLDDKHRTQFELKYGCGGKEFIFQFTKDTGVTCFFVGTDGMYSCWMDVDIVRTHYVGKRHLGAKPVKNQRKGYISWKKQGKTL